MPNGLAICTPNGVKEFPIPKYYSAQKGRVRLEGKKLETVFFQLIGKGKGFIMDTLDPMTTLTFTPNMFGRKLYVAISETLVQLYTSPTRYSLLRLSVTSDQNPEQLQELRELLKTALGDQVEIK